MNTILSHSCIKTRHQSASVDKIKLKIELENEFAKNPTIQDFEDYVKGCFEGQVNVDPSTIIVTPSKEISLDLDLSMNGDEAQLGVKRFGQVSISPRFYKHVFHTNVFCVAVICLQFGFVIYW